MKINGQHFDALAAAVSTYDTDERREAYRNGDFPRADLVRDLDKRYRWDTFWLAFNGGYNLNNLCVATRCNNAHIDTALRRIVPALG